MIIHESIKTPVNEQCDVLVCGGGFAGISAALAASRQGKRYCCWKSSLFWAALQLLAW